MYLVAVGWLYVALMMALAELVHPSGGALGALVTFVLYGLAPVGLLMYLMATPLRKKARLKAELAAAQALAAPADQTSVSTFASAGTPDTADTEHLTVTKAPTTDTMTTASGGGSGMEPDAGCHATGAAAVTSIRKEV